MLFWAETMEIKMDLTKFDFPETTKLDMAFPTFGTIPELLSEAKERKFYGGNTPFNGLFSDLFFCGGEVKFREDIDKEFLRKAWGYCRAFMQSFEPKHEEKEAICAMIMSEVLVSPKQA